MGMVLEFPADAVMRRQDAADPVSPGATATVLILPVIRVERHDVAGETDGPELDNASGGGRRPRRRG